VGFATGIERIVINLKANGVEPPPLPAPEVFVAVGTPDAAAVAFALADELRRAGIHTQLAAGGHSLRSQFRLAGRLDVPYVAVIGDDELQADTVTLRDMRANEQRTVARDRAVAELTGNASIADTAR
jgi:histidyl-tRNA synthetase